MALISLEIGAYPYKLYFTSRVGPERMPRIARAVAIGCPHQITQRGNYRQPVFEEDGDYQHYLSWLSEYTKRYSLNIWAYCLMKNHVHFVCVPAKSDSLARTFSSLHMRYSQYFNQKKDLKGHLWQGRFFSCILDDCHAYEEVRYIENNPVRAGIVDRAEDYPWSSARSHVFGERDAILFGKCHLVREISDWRAYLEEKGNEILIRQIRENIRSGRPCGDGEFVKKIERKLGMRLRPLQRGRPSKIKRSC